MEVAVFGEVQLSLFLAGAVFGESLNDSRSMKCVVFGTKCLWARKVTSVARRVAD